VFLDALLADESFNPTAAARAAGYRDGKKTAYRLMQNPIVLRALRRAQRERAERCRITADAVLRELGAIGLFDPAEMLAKDGSLLPLKRMPRRVRAAIKEVTLQYAESEDPEKPGVFNRLQFANVKFRDKEVCLGLLAKHLGLLVDKTHQQAERAAPLQIDWSQMYEQDPASDEIENRLRREEGLPPLAPPEPPTASNGAGNGKLGDGKANGTNGRRAVPPRKTSSNPHHK
jgi:phage terminase small subunit